MTNGLFVCWSTSKTASGPHPLPRVKALIAEKGGTASPSLPEGFQLVTEAGEILVTNGDVIPLTDTERTDLAQREASIEAKLALVESVLDDILYIHEHKLYREQGTWEAYCKTRWGKSRQHGYRLVNFLSIAGNLSPVATIENEWQARQFSPLKDDPIGQQEAAIIAIETAAAIGMDKPTAEVYHAAVEMVVELKATNHVSVDEVQVKPGQHLPADKASIVNKAAEIVMENRERQRGQWAYQRMQDGRFEGCLGEVSDWINSMIPHLGGEKRVVILVYEERPKP